MGSEGVDEAREQGYALLVAATPAGAHPVMAATEALPGLAATPPAVLLGTAHGSVVQLADPADPHVVLAQLRTAAAHRGPLLLYVAGHLMLDSRQRLPHLALAKSTPRSVRYTGLPWHWLEAELAGRPPGSTTLVADLVADEGVHRHRLVGSVEAYGCLTPPPAKRQTRAPLYSRSLAALLRVAPERPPLWELHQQAARDAGVTGREVFLGGGPAPGFPVRDASAPSAGREETSGQTYGGYGGGFGPAPVSGQAPAYGQAPVYGEGAPPADAPASVPGRVSAEGPGASAGREETSAQAGAAAGAVVPPMPASPPGPPPGWAPSTPPSGAAAPDPHQAIGEAAQAGRHGEAMAVAIAWETAALRAGGPGSADAIHWTEVRADLAHRAGDDGRACELWLHAAGTRLQTGQDPGADEVFGAVDRAHHCWQRLEDPQEAVRFGQRLAELREWAPGRQQGALEDVRTRLAQAEQSVNATPPVGR